MNIKLTDPFYPNLLEPSIWFVDPPSPPRIRCPTPSLLLGKRQKSLVQSKMRLILYQRCFLLFHQFSVI